MQAEKNKDKKREKQTASNPIDPEKEKYCQEFLGTSELLDPETFIDPGFSVSSLNNDDEEVNIWTHIDSKASKEHYIMYQDWLKTDHDSQD